MRMARCTRAYSFSTSGKFKLHKPLGRGALAPAPSPNHHKISSLFQIFLGAWPALPRKLLHVINNLFNTPLVHVWCHHSQHLKQVLGGGTSHLYGVTQCSLFCFISKACAGLELLLIPSLGPSSSRQGVPSTGEALTKTVWDLQFIFWGAKLALWCFPFRTFLSHP